MFADIQASGRGNPVELYNFSQLGVETRVTSAATTQFNASVEFPPLPGLRRTRPVQSNESNSGEIQITVPRDFTIARQFRNVVPSSYPVLTIYKRHLNDPDGEVVAYWKGVIVNCAFNDREGTATLYGRTSQRLFERPIPRAVYSGLCNHQLFDAGCQVIRADFSAELEISTVDSAGTGLTISGLRDAAVAIVADQSLTLTAQQIDDFWNRGIIGTVESPSEFRMIVQTDVGDDPDAVRVTLPFLTAGVGASINVAAGCPHSIGFCANKFNNAENFGGYPYVPTNNPFQIELGSGRASSNTATPRRGFT